MTTTTNDTAELDATAADGTRWANGITLKRTSYGYTWSISVGATDCSPAALYVAVTLAEELDQRLQARYPTPPPPRRR